MPGGRRFDDLIGGALSYLSDYTARHGVISDAAVTEAKRLLSGCTAACKEYTLLFAGHAHIDMNWQWRYDETASITLDTLRTALNLMQEFPDFTFSQSQASIYAIVEQFEPEMLEEIRGRIACGQWEVTASTWVEAAQCRKRCAPPAVHQALSARAAGLPGRCVAAGF